MYDKIKQYIKSNKSFHMPGHKNGKLRLIDDLYDLDVTEVPGTDDMHHPSGVILKARQQISQIYGSRSSYLLVNGSTSGLLAGISGVTKPDGLMLMARNCHKSVYNSAYLNKQKVEYLYPDYLAEGFYDALTVDVFDQLVGEEFEFSQVDVCVLTSPTYEGAVSDIRAISDFLHDYGIVLIVDEAHGAHFNFDEKGPVSALELGADIVVQSAHKTLPCMTQTGLLHISKEAVESGRVDQFRIEKFLSMYQSSSPSYVFMASILRGVSYMQDHRKNLVGLGDGIEEAIKERKLRWLAGKGQDRFRLTGILPDDISMTGWELEKKLRKEKQIQVELSGEKHIVAIVTIADTIEDVRELLDIIDGIISLETKHKKASDPEEIPGWPRSEARMDLAEADNKESYRLSIKKAGGEVSADYIIPYPPGIPVLVPGEVIDPIHVEKIRELIRHNKEVYGIMNGEIKVIRH